MSFLRNVFGGSTTPTTQEISGAETIERLCDRVQSSSLLDDRRDAVKAIRSLSKKYKLDVGTQTMPVLIDILEKDRNDTEICNYALDILFNIMSYDETNNEEQKDLPSDLTQQFSEVYIKEKENVQLLINLLDEFEFRIKWPTVRLLNQLILNCRKQMQELLMSCPMAISKLMDLLVDSREIIRNDVILLLNNLIKSHANIQKIVVFENCYERLFEIIDNEGGCLDGGIIVEDCLQLLLNLISNNSSNQSFFIEGNYIKRICKYFDLNANDDHHQQQQQSWSPQQLKNFNLLLKCIRTLVSPSNQQTTIHNCQKSINYCGLLHRLCAMLMISGVPPDLLTETISTVGEVIRGNESNQQFFASVMAPSIPPRQIIILLLMSMINEKQPFMLRLSILYCLQSYLYRNENGQAQIIDSLLLPPSSNVGDQQLTSGQLLCAGLFNNDPISNWLCASAISHSILDNNKQKGQLLRVQLSNQLSNQTITFMQQCVSILQATDAAIEKIGTVSSANGQTNTNKNQITKISILMLLSTWLCEDKTSVTYFLSQTNNVPYLISQISAHETDDKCLIIQGLCAFLLGLCVLFNSNQVELCTQDKLRDTIKKRIGIEQFEDKLEYISQSELYTKILQKQLLNYTSADQLVYDYEFLRLFKSNETIIMKVLKTTAAIGSNGVSNNINEQQQNSVIITQYKQLIREQDQQLNEYKLNLIEQQQINKTLHETLKQLESNYQLLKDQHSLLRATTLNNASSSYQMAGGYNNNDDEINKLRIEIENLKQQNSYYENELNKRAFNNNNYNNSNGCDHHMNGNNDLTAATNNYIEQLKNEIINERTVSYELRNELERKNEEINLLRMNGNSSVENLTNDARVHELKLQINMLNDKLNEQSDLISKLKREKGVCEEKLINSNTNSQPNQKIEHDLRQQQLENNSLKQELKKLNEEQENLLFLLQEMEDKCKNYRKLLKQYGYTMIEDEDEDDDEAVLNDDAH